MLPDGDLHRALIQRVRCSASVPKRPTSELPTPMPTSRCDVRNTSSSRAQRLSVIPQERKTVGRTSNARTLAAAVNSLTDERVRLIVAIQCDQRACEIGPRAEQTLSPDA